MMPVVASALQLPFGDLSFDAVIASDMLEHVPPQGRQSVIHEALRVARRLVLIGFPYGRRAYALDQRLWAHYRKLNVPAPSWLDEHMAFPFPDGSLFSDLDPGWTVKSIGNDNLWFHAWLVRRQLSARWSRLFALAQRMALGPLEHVLRLADWGPCYRRIFALTRRTYTSERDRR
jgi:hypothetical protein